LKTTSSKQKDFSGRNVLPEQRPSLEREVINSKMVHRVTRKTVSPIPLKWGEGRVRSNRKVLRCREKDVRCMAEADENRTFQRNFCRRGDGSPWRRG